MNINDYFELYIKNKIKYDRHQHIKNLGIAETTTITPMLIRKIFTYIDAVLFNSSLKKYTDENYIDFKFKVSKTLTSTAGMFYWKSTNGKLKEAGFKISHSFFQNIIDNNTLNVDLGVVDEKNRPYLSTNTIEPLMVTMEHEIVHMVMRFTTSNKFNDLSTVKSGHTKVFKLLVNNIFGHYRITHSYAIGDVKKSREIKDSIDLGDFVKDLSKGIEGYVVGKKERYLVVCIIEKTKNTYIASMYKDLEKVELDEKDKVDVIGLIDRLKQGVKIQYDDREYTIKKINQVTILAETDEKRVWKIPVFRILDIVFLE